jgi:hypothetical protein
MIDIIILKEVLFMLFGGIVTFCFAFILIKLKDRQAKIYWESLPPLVISNQNLVGESWIVENDGKISAKNIRILVKAPEQSTFSSIDLVSSVDALKYNIEDGKSSSEKIITIPTFTQGVILKITSLMTDVGEDPVLFSVIGEDIIGHEKIRTEKKSVWLSVATYFTASYIIFFTAIAIYIQVSVHNNEQNYTNFLRDSSIVRLYVSSGNIEGGIKYLHDFKRSNTNTRYILPLDYELAKLYALSNNQSEALSILTKLNIEGVLVESLLNTDPAFKSINKHPKFIEMIASLKEHDKSIKQANK